MLKNLVGMTIFTLGLALLVPAGARAADPGFCRDYATAAIRQAEVARSVPACSRASGPRWITDYRVHFEWCLGAAPGAAEAERAARTNWLRACRGWACRAKAYLRLAG